MFYPLGKNSEKPYGGVASIFPRTHGSEVLAELHARREAARVGEAP